ACVPGDVRPEPSCTGRLFSPVCSRAVRKPQFLRRSHMATDTRLKEALPELTDRMVATYTELGKISHLGHSSLPSTEAVVEIIEDLKEVLYPGYRRRQNLNLGNVAYHVGDIIDGLH